VNAFYDATTEYKHRRSSVGLEAMGKTFTVLAPAAGACAARTLATAQDVAITAIQTALALPANSALGLAVSGGNLIHTYELSTPLTISKAGSLPQVQIDFSTANGHQCVSSVSYPGVPSVSIRVFEN